MIQSFASEDVELLFFSHSVKKFKAIETIARRKLLQIHASTALSDLRIPPGNRLEALKGSLKGKHSIRVNDQWRIVFEWRNDGVHSVNIVDYH